MNPYIFLFIVIFLIIYKIYSIFFNRIDKGENYIIGILDDNEPKLVISEIVGFCDGNYSFKIYDSEKDLINDTNSGILDFSVLSEGTVIDGGLGLNSFTKKMENISFVTGLYFGNFYFISNILYKNKEKTKKMSGIGHIKQFYINYGRNLVIGTENKQSLSFRYLIELLYMLGLKPIDVRKKNESYEDIISSNIVYYYTSDIEKVACKFIDDTIDCIFLFKPDNNLFIKNIIDKKEVLFLDIEFTETFNNLFSSYYYNKEITISGNEDSFYTKYTIKTKNSRLLLISNKNVNNKTVHELVNSYYTHNNLIINRLNNKNSIDEHYLFEPIDMIYINKFIPIHNSSIKYFESLGFILGDKLKSTLENKGIINKTKLNYYWKYDKIGLNKFKL